MQAGAGLLDALGNIQQVARAARQAVQPGDNHHIAGTQVIERHGQLNPVVPGAGDLLRKNPDAAGRVQLRPLVGQILVFGADTGIAQQQAAADQVQGTEVAQIAHGVSCFSGRCFSLCNRNARHASAWDIAAGQGVAGFRTCATCIFH